MSAARSVVDVLADMVSNVQEIVRAEIHLARAEVGDEIRRASTAGILIAVGLMGGFLSALFLLQAIADALSLVVPTWAAALIVAIPPAIIAAVTLSVGVRRLKRSPPLPHTVSMQENLEWAKERTR